MGKRGPPPTPTNVLKRRGSWRGNRNPGEPRPEPGRPRCPSWLGDYAKAAWRHLVPMLDRMAVLTKVDCNALAMDSLHDNMPFAVIPIQTDVLENLTARVLFRDTTIRDTVLSLHCAFDPLSPMDGLIAYDDEEVPGLVPTRIDLNGVSQSVTRHSQPIIRIRLAPDGKKAAVTIPETNILETSAWLLDFERDLLTKLTPEEGNQNYPIFSNDSDWVYYTQWNSGTIQFDGLYRRRVDGSGEPERLAIDTTRSFDEIRIQLDNFSPDGQTLYLSISRDKFESNLTPPMDIYTLTLDDELKLKPLIATPAHESSAAPSPDGRWLAYVSQESGLRQIYIRPIDGHGARVQVSRDGGRYPAWSPDGSILYFSPPGRMISGVPISISEEPDGTPIVQVGAISMLFSTESPYAAFDLYPDGEHILMLSPGQRKVEDRTEIKVTLNFFEELKRLAPATNR